MYSFEILIKSFIRFNGLKKLLDSIEEHYPGVVVRIADDSPTRKNHGDFPVEHLDLILKKKEKLLAIISNKDNIHFYELPFDVGLSAGRNHLLDKCQTRYFVVMEDDFVVTEETDLLKFEKVIRSSPDIAIVGGEAVERSRKLPEYKQRLRSMGHFIIEGDCLVLLKYGSKAPTVNINGVKCVQCRFLRNIFMGNIELFKKYQIRWNEDIKMTREHAYFFHTLPEELKVYCALDVWIDHYWNKPVYYRKYRVRQSGIDAFKRATNGLDRCHKKDRYIYT